MTVQKSAASMALASLSRNTTSTSPPTKTTSTILMVREPMSWRRRLVMASWSRLAIKAASDRATPSRREQTRRRVTGPDDCPTLSPHARGHFCDALGHTPFRQLIHNTTALCGAHPGPAGDFINRAPASEAKALTGVDSADFDAGCLDHGRLKAESSVTISTARRKAIARLSQG